MTSFWVRHYLIDNSLIDKVRKAQSQDPMLVELKEELQNDSGMDLTIWDDDALVLNNRLCVSDDKDWWGIFLNRLIVLRM